MVHAALWKLASRPHFLRLRPGLFWLGRREVATWDWRRDLAWSPRRSRPGSDVATWPGQGLGQFGVATWSFKVATWDRLPGRVATSASPASARLALVVRVTCARPVGCALSSAHDLGTARATWFLGVRTVHTTQFCDSALFRVTVWILFMDTVHEHCSHDKKKYKIFKKLLVYDLKYKIFILKLL